MLLVSWFWNTSYELKIVRLKTFVLAYGFGRICILLSSKDWFENVEPLLVLERVGSNYLLSIVNLGPEFWSHVWKLKECIRTKTSSITVWKLHIFLKLWADRSETIVINIRMLWCYYRELCGVSTHCYRPILIISVVNGILSCFP